MKVTLQQIADATGAMKNGQVGALHRLVELEPEASVSFQIARIAHMIEPERINFREQYVNLIKKYGKENDDGLWYVLAEKAEEHQAELDGLLITEVELPGVEPLNIKLLDKIKVRVADMMALGFMFTDESHG